MSLSTKAGAVWADESAKAMPLAIPPTSNFIHGTDGNPIQELAKQTGTRTASIGEENRVYDENGTPLDPAKAREASDIFWGIIAQGFEHSNRSSRQIPPEESLKDFVMRKLDASDADAQTKKLALQIAEMWGAFVGEPVDRQSLKWFFLEEVISGENLFVTGTYRKILDHVAQPALARADMHFSTVVTSVVATTLQEGKHKVALKTADGEAAAFDAAIVTVPLGSLKNANSLFEPPLPTPLAAAIRHISYGRLEKAYLTFPRAFWNQAGSPDPSAALPIFTSFLHPQYAPLNPSGRIVQCCALSAFPGGPPTLLFYVHGPLSAALGAHLVPHDPASAPEAHRAAVADFFRPYYARLPGYDAADFACEPTAVLATAWHRDPLAGYGSYSCFLTPEPGSGGGSGGDEVQLDRDIATMRKGMPERAVWLAGEHTAPFVALGTVTGALWSGERVAERVVRWLHGEEDGGWEEEDPGQPTADSDEDPAVQVGKATASSSGDVKVPKEA